MFYVIEDKIVEFAATSGGNGFETAEDAKKALEVREVNSQEVRRGMRGHQMVGIGGAPSRVSILPDDPKERKKYPIATGFLDYFPDAVAEVSLVSYTGNEQHNPGQPVHWDRDKSKDEADTMMRHFMARGTRDKDGLRHMAKAVWRSLALLQKEIEEDAKKNS
jgi:hypothetical protein